MIKVNSLCCCGLSTAALVFGYLGIVGSLICLISFSTFLHHLNDVLYPKNKEYSPEKYGIEPEMLRTVVEIVIGVLILLAVVEIVTSLCLIIGTMKKNHLLIVPWLTKQAIGLVCGGFFLFFLFGLAFFSEADIGPVIMTIIIVSGGLVFNIFLWLAIRSLFARIKESSKQSYLTPNEKGSLYTIPHKRF